MCSPMDATEYARSRDDKITITDDAFRQHRIAFEVSPDALGDVLHVLKLDFENDTRVKIIKKNGRLLVLYARMPRATDTVRTEENPKA